MKRLFSLLCATLTVALSLGQALAAPKFILTWADKSNNEDKFEIERANGPTGAFAKLNEVTANTTTFTDTTITTDVNFCYRVRAVNLAGNSGYTNTACRLFPSAAPAPPDTLQLDAAP